MEPTPLAHEISNHISPALARLHQGLNTSVVFDPASSDIELTFSATDYTQFSLLPKLISKISEVAPQMRITVIPSEDKIPTEKLLSGELDFVLGFSHEIEKSSTIERQTWLQDSYCTIARKNHPQLTKGLTLAKFLSLAHVRIAPWGEKQGVVDVQLSKQGLNRHVALQLPSVLAAPYTIVNSDHLLTFPRLMAEHVSTMIDIDIYDPPIELPDYQLNVYWHKLNNSKDSHRWLTQLITQL